MVDHGNSGEPAINQAGQARGGAEVRIVADRERVNARLRSRRNRALNARQTSAVTEGLRLMPARSHSVPLATQR
jgi:hypothetical protein